MAEIQESKALVLHYFEELAVTLPGRFAKIIERYAGAGYRCRGVHPFNELEGSEETAATIWQPLFGAFTRLQRRQDIFMAGPNRLDGAMWVTSMGKFLGLFDHDWLGIPPTGKMVLLPYCEFHRISEGRIAESALFLDIISVMKQAGLYPLPLQTGAEIINPGPRAGDGLLFEAQPEAESRRTLDLIMKMCDDLIADGLESPPETLAETWHEDMVWFGPSGIGATYTTARYQYQHQGPFRAGLRDIQFTGHVLEHAEGSYGGWFGWPNLTMKPAGGFLGLPASDRTVEMRVVDIYRRDGDRLAENWIFIDFLHYLMMQDVDVLERTKTILRR